MQIKYNKAFYYISNTCSESTSFKIYYNQNSTIIITPDSDGNFILKNAPTTTITSLYRFLWYNQDNITWITSIIFGDNFDTSKVTNMQEMFYNCSGLTSLNLSNWNTSNVTSMTNMFSGCSSLKSITCKSAFQTWCSKNKKTLGLTNYYDNITWTIVS